MAFPFILSLLFVSSLTPPLLAATEPDEHPAMDCASTSCGSVTDITYPFWVQDKQPSHCGFPAFKLTCENQTLVLSTTPQVHFRVLQIFYENQSALLTYPDLLASPCPVRHWNLPFSLTPFNLSRANREVVFLFDCPEPPRGGYYYKVPCEDNGSSGTYAQFADRLESPVECKRAVMPVVDYSGKRGVGEYVRLLGNGFLVEWTAANCTDCRESKGQCGYSQKNDNFMCICPDRAHWRSCNGKKSHTLGIVLGTVAGAIILLACFVIFMFRRRKRLRQASQSSDLLTRSTSSKISSRKDPESAKTNYNTHIFTYDELEEATNCFSASRELGDGGFGTVYKGKLHDGRTVAVKRLYENNYRRLEQFMNEVEILSRLRHQNLVTLYGCTSRHSRELLLVYEYIPNGTLADHLHGPLTSSRPPLPWSTRMSIAIETADALAYLHAVEPQIIHRDVKTNNILLDNNFHVKVADFGLSRLFPLDATHVSTAPQGTPGYVDPEYHQCYQLTEKSDVYSFGVVLVELISSKPAVDISRRRSEINLSSMAIAKIKNQEIDQLVYAELGYHSDAEVRRMINEVAELALRCLQPDRDTRPCIREALAVLQEIEAKESKTEMSVEVSEAQANGKTGLPFSPDSVAERWSSRSTTPNTSSH